MKNILITGGAGFIGSNLIDHLLNLGHKIICIDNFDNNYSREIKERNLEFAKSNKNFSFIEGNIINIHDLNKCFLQQLPGVVIHLAAKSGVRPSINNPYGYYESNVLGTLNLLEVMKTFRVKKMLFASSSSVYGNNKKIPFSETDNVDGPISPYAASKKACELLCHTYHHLYGFDIYCLRFFSVYGPRQRPDLAIQKFTEKILNGEVIQMYGDGSSSRDYTYIDDLICGITNALENIKGYEIFNMGESTVISLKQLIKMIEKQLGKKAIIEQVPFQPGDVMTTFANIEKAKNTINYRPKWKIEDGIKEFINWKKL